MKIAAAFAASLAAILAACASTGAPEPAPEPSFFVMRHLHKAAGDDPELTPQGQDCARRLALFLARRGVRAAYASTTRRARQTAAPLAAAYGITVQEYPAAETQAVVARAQAEPRSVLIVGHSNTVPDIVEQLGGVRPGPIGDTQYADVWRVARSGGATEMLHIPGC